MQLGPVRCAVDARSEAARRSFEHRLIVRDTAFSAPARAGSSTIQDLYAALAGDEKRNELILNDVIASLEEGRSPILLTERKDHLEYLAERLRRFARHLVVLHGTMNTRSRSAAREQLVAIPPDEERLLLATGRYIGEGFDDARLDTSSWPCPFPGRAPSSSMRADCIASTRARLRFGSSTMWTPTC
jgi:superfamily II DNA or RNA helicase